MLAPDDGVVYFDSLWDDRVYALDAASGEELWRFEEGSANSAPSVSKGVIYFSIRNLQGLFALDAASGSRLKLYTGDPHSYFYAQTVADGVVYASNNDGYLYALPAVTPALAQETGAQPADETVSASATPELLWHYRPEGVVMTPATVSNGVVYFGSAVIEDKELKDSFLYALDAAGGELLWRVRPGPAGSFFGISNMTHTTTGGVLYYLAGDGVRALDGDSGALLWDDVSAEASMEIWSYALAAAEGLLYVRSVIDDTDVLDALDGVDGTRLWRYSSELVIAGSAPAVYEGKVYIDEPKGMVTELDAASGEVRQRLPTGGVDRLMGSVIAVHEGSLYVVSNDFHFYVLDIDGGRLLWRKDIGGTLGSSLAADDGIVFVSSSYDDYLYAFEAATGDRLWRIAVPFAHISALSAAAGVVYVVSDDGYLYALEAASGELIWRYKEEEGEGFDIYLPTVADGVVYVSSKDGTLYAFRAHQTLDSAERSAP